MSIPDYPKYLLDSRIWASMLMLLLVTSTTHAQKNEVSDFNPVGYQLELDGETVQDARTFQSRSTGSILILSSAVPAPVLIKQREVRVETLNLSKVNHDSNGTVTLLTEATLAEQGPFKLTADRKGIEFEVEGKHGLLRKRPALLGHHDIADLEKHSPEYRRTADAYSPSDSVIARLQNERNEVVVRMFFGSWCSHCEHVVPRMIKVAEQLKDSKIKFDFYGVPRRVSSDPIAKKAGITAVPAGVVYLDGKEIGRIPGKDWKQPEQAIDSLLTSSAKNPSEIRDSGNLSRAEVNSADKAEIEKIIKDYLMEHPEVIMNSLAQYRQRQQQEMQEQASKVIKEKMDFLASVDAPSVGNKVADVTVIEFFDYNCGYCKKAVPDIQNVIKEDDNVRIVFREMPILGPTSMTAAQWALAAHKQGRYFDFYVALMEHRGQKDENSLAKLARDLGLDVEQMKMDAKSKEIADAIAKDIAVFREIGIRGTPAFIINGELFSGNLGSAGFKEAIESARKDSNNKKG